MDIHLDFVIILLLLYTALVQQTLRKMDTENKGRVATMTDTIDIAEGFEPDVAPAASRRLTVSYTHRPPGLTRISALTLSGQWLEDAGFTTGTGVDVRVMHGCIVLTAIQPPDEPPMLQSLRRACKLSARKQKQVEEFIEVIGGRKKTKPEFPRRSR